MHELYIDLKSFLTMEYLSIDIKLKNLSFLYDYSANPIAENTCYILIFILNETEFF